MLDCWHPKEEFVLNFIHLVLLWAKLCLINYLSRVRVHERFFTVVSSILVFKNQNWVRTFSKLKIVWSFRIWSPNVSSCYGFDRGATNATFCSVLPVKAQLDLANILKIQKLRFFFAFFRSETSLRRIWRWLIPSISNVKGWDLKKKKKNVILRVSIW